MYVCHEAVACVCVCVCMYVFMYVCVCVVLSFMSYRQGHSAFAFIYQEVRESSEEAVSVSRHLSCNNSMNLC